MLQAYAKKILKLRRSRMFIGEAQPHRYTTPLGVKCAHPVDPVATPIALLTELTNRS